MVGGIFYPAFCILRIWNPIKRFTAGYANGLKLASLTVGSKGYKNWDCKSRWQAGVSANRRHIFVSGNFTVFVQVCTFTVGA